MRGNFGSRHAEEFDALLTGDAEPTAAQSDLLEIVAALRATPEVTARPEFVSALRTQLVAAAQREPARVEQELAVRLTPRQRRGSADRKIAAAVGGFAIVAASGSMAMASQGALPGDVLYPVKRAIENAETNLKSDRASKASSLIAHAEARLGEVRKLTAQGADADSIAETLEDFTVQADQAAEFALSNHAATGRTEGVTDLRAFAASSMDTLTGLAPVVPESVRPILVTASQTVRQIDLTAWEACPTCAGGDLAEVPSFATHPVSLALYGVPTTAASVTRTDDVPADVPPVKPSDLPTDVPTTPASPTRTDHPTPGDQGDPADKPAPTATTKPDPVTGLVDKTLDGVTGGITDGLGLGTTSESSSNGGLAGTLVDGVVGLLGILVR